MKDASGMLLSISPAFSNELVQKICIINPPLITVPPAGYGGLERLTYNLAYVLANKMGKQVTVVAGEGSYVEGCTMHFIKLGTSEEVALKSYEDLLLRERFDIIHDNTWGALVYNLKARHPHLPLCHTHHGGIGTAYGWASKPGLNMVAVSNFMQKEYRKAGVESTVIYYCVNTDAYKFQPNKGNRLLFLGRLDIQKQPDVAIEVAHQAGLHIDVIGPSSSLLMVPYVMKLKMMCSNQCQLQDTPTEENKITLLQNAKAVLIPSNFGEPFNLVAIEAMSTGTPVICLNDGGLAEVVEEGVTGFVCRTKDDMIRAIDRLDIIDPKKCRERVLRLFSREVMAASYLRFYEKVIRSMI